MTAADKVAIAERINETLNGRVWCPDVEKDTAHVRIYTATKGHIVIADDGHANIDCVGRRDFDDAKAACETAGVEAKRW